MDVMYSPGAYYSQIQHNGQIVLGNSWKIRHRELETLFPSLEVKNLPRMAVDDPHRL